MWPSSSVRVVTTAGASWGGVQRVRHFGIDRLEKRAAALDADRATAARDTEIEVDGRRCADRADAVERLNAILKAGMAHASFETTRRTLGTYRGLRLTLETRRGQHPELLVGGAVAHFLEFRAPAAGSLLNRVDHLVEGWPAEAAKAREQRRVKHGQLDPYRERIGLAFEQEEPMETLHALRGELESLLSGPGEEDTRGRINAAVAAFQAMKDTPDLPPAPAPEAEPPHHAPRRVVHEEPEASDAPAIVVPFPHPEAEPSPPFETPPAPPAWTARVRDKGRPSRQASLFDPPHPVAPEPEPRAAAGEKSWRKAVGGKPTQLSLF